MIKLASTSLIAVALGLGLTLAAGSVFAGPPPPPKDPAACSPGFFKNNLEKWCPLGSIADCPGSTASIDDCESFIPLLSAEQPFNSPRAVREAAATILNSCFGTAANSPCDD